MTRGKIILRFLALILLTLFYYHNQLFAVQGGEEVEKVEKGEGEQQSLGVVNINTASIDQLMLLPGIGEKKAKLIIESREKHPFTRIEQLTRIKGIGKVTIQRLRPYVVFSGETTLKSRIKLSQIPKK